MSPLGQIKSDSDVTMQGLQQDLQTVSRQLSVFAKALETPNKESVQISESFSTCIPPSSVSSVIVSGISTCTPLDLQGSLSDTAVAPSSPPSPSVSPMVLSSLSASFHSRSTASDHSELTTNVDASGHTQQFSSGSSDNTIKTCPSPSNPRSLTLANQIVVAYSDADIPPPLALRVTENKLELLFKWWDDQSPEWDPRGYRYNLNGYTVAIKYWGEIYQRTQYWRDLKRQWGLWKVSVFFPSANLNFLIQYL